MSEYIRREDMLNAVEKLDIIPSVDSDKRCHPDGLLRRKDDDFCSYGEKREE